MHTQRLILRLLFGFASVLILLGLAHSVAAQHVRRWLAEPALLAAPKTIGPSGGVRVPDSVSDISLVQTSVTKGWVTRTSGVWRLDGGVWELEQAASSTASYNAVSMEDETHGWVVGSETERVPPYTSHALMVRYDGAAWQGDAQVTRADGTRGTLEGRLNDVVTLPDGTAWAVGTQPAGQPFQGRPLLLYFDGSAWYDRTPDAFRSGALTSLAMLGTDDGWAAGTLGRPGGEGVDALRPTILRYKDGLWNEEPVPGNLGSGQPFTVFNLAMRDASDGWAIFLDAGTECSFGTLLHYNGSAWSVVAPNGFGDRSISALGLIPGTNRGWVSLGGCQARGQNNLPQRARFDNGRVALDTAGAQLAPNVYALLSDDEQWAAAGASLMRYSDEVLPTERVGGAGTGERFFPETGHTIAGEFRRYYETHGLELGDRGITARESLALFGYPLSQPYAELNPEDGKPYLVQYFERARFELHPENAVPYRVLLGRLGALELQRRSNNVEPRIPNPDAAEAAPGCVQFREVVYDLCAPFLAFWRGSGSLPVFGFPIVNARNERNLTDDRTYQTQWFERERMEQHPENAGTHYEVLLGLLGAEELRVRGYLP